MAEPGDVVTVDFPGAQGVKRRPALVISTPTYHQYRPDVVLGLITSQTAVATGPTDYILQDWTAAHLNRPSAFRAFLVTVPVNRVAVVGHISQRDWQEIQSRLRIALAVV